MFRIADLQPIADHEGPMPDFLGQPDPEETRGLYAEQVALLYRHAPASLLATVVNSIILAVVQRAMVSPVAIAAWLACILGVTLLRYILLASYRRTASASIGVQRWGKWFLAGTACAGVVWGSAGILLFPGESVIHQAFVVFVLGGMVAGAAATLASVSVAFPVFMVPTLLPLALRLFSIGDEVHLAMGIMILVFVSFILYVNARIHATTVESLQLRFENRGLVAHLKKATEQAEGSIEDLKSEIAERVKAEKALREGEERFRVMADHAPVMLWMSGTDGLCTFFNKPWLDFTGQPLEHEVGNGWSEGIHPDDLQRYLNDYLSAFNSRQAFRSEARLRRFDGEYRWILDTGIPRYGPDGGFAGYIGSCIDITERKRMEKLLTGEHKVLEMVASDRHVQLTLDAITTMIEELAPGTMCSILTVDEEGRRLFHGSAPSLPEEYLRQIDGLVIGPDAGVCGTAAYRREMVIVEDASTDPLTAAYRDLVQRYGLYACWAIPVLGSTGALLGTLALYDRQPHRPSEEDILLVHTAAHLAGMAIERDQSEQALRDSESKFRAITQTAADAIVLIDEQGKIAYWNAAAERIFGYASDEILGRDLHRTLAPPQYHQAYREGFAGFKASGQGPVIGGKLEFMALKKDGSEFPIEVSTSALSMHNRWYALGIIRDITNRKRAEEELVRASREWERTFNAVPELIAILDNEYRMIRVNKAMADKLGMTAEEVVGETCYTYVHGTDRPPKFCPHTQLLADGQEHSAEVFEERLGADYLVTTSPLYDSDGHLMGSVHVAHDITERRRAEEERVRLATAIEQASDSVIIMDRDGTIRYVNPAFEALSGFTREETVGKGLHILASARHDDTFYKAMWDTITQGKVWSGRISTSRKNGRPRELKVTISPIRDSSGGIVNFVSVSRDVTQEVALEAQLRQAQKMEAIGTLAGGIAHDFNNILMAIIGYVELSMLEAPEGTRMRKRLTAVHNAGRRAKELVKQILAYSRQSESQRVPVRVGSMVKEVLRLVRATLPATIEITQEIQSAEGMILADPTQIHQVVLNLCTNAADAMQEKGGKLEVRLTEERIDPEEAEIHLDLQPGPYLKLAISDTGHGIESSVMDRIFDPFFTTKEPGRGTGMGLSVVQGIVKSHGGAISVSSSPEKGTTFDIFFPKVVGQISIDTEEAVMLPTGHERILFVDDEPDLVDLAKQTLEHLGYRVTASANSIDALKTFRDRADQFDLVITDQTMPHLTGVGLTREITRIRPGIPIILCTGFSESITQEEAMAIGVREFVMKPFVGRELAETVRRVLDREQARGDEI
jgi:PAS domain S-box-containing protein